MDITDLVYIDSTGYHYADYPTFLQWRQDQYRAIYGADVYLEADSQDGQLLAIQALSDFQTAAVGAAVYSSFSPSGAQGTGLSRLVKINGISRRDATHSTCDVDIVGQTGTVIQNGVVIDILNQKWNLPAIVTIPSGGTITVTVTAQDEGAIRAEANTINKIYTPTLGWQTVNNAAAATVGVAIETDAELRVRQTQSTAIPAQTVFDASIGAVENVTGVTRVRGYENDTGSTDGNGIPAHSISLVVEGGDSIEIAQTIANKKTPGTGTYGTTSETVTDSRGMPITIHFYRPTQVTIDVAIGLDTGTGWSDNYITDIQNSVADYVNSIGIGNTVLYSKMFTAAYLPAPIGGTYDIVSLTIAKNGGLAGTSNILINFNEVAICDADTDVTVTT